MSLKQKLPFLIALTITTILSSQNMATALTIEVGLPTRLLAIVAFLFSTFCLGYILFD